jgi:hypothetical protein
LSRGALLSRAVICELILFMTESGRTVPQSPNEEWIVAPAFVV